MDISYKPTFVRQFKKLEPALQAEVLEKIELFRDTPSHTTLRVHPLSGKLRGCHSFSVNYAIRIVFEYETPQSVVLLGVGNHDIYK